MMILGFQVVIFVSIVCAGKYRWLVASLWSIETVSFVFVTWLTVLQFATIGSALFIAYVNSDLDLEKYSVDRRCRNCLSVHTYFNRVGSVQESTVCQTCGYTSIHNPNPIVLVCKCRRAEVATFKNLKREVMYGKCSNCSRPWFLRAHNVSTRCAICRECSKVFLVRNKNSVSAEHSKVSPTCKFLEQGQFREVFPANSDLVIRPGLSDSVRARALRSKTRFSNRSGFAKVRNLRRMVSSRSAIVVVVVCVVFTFGTFGWEKIRTTQLSAFEKCGAPSGWESAAFTQSDAQRILESGTGRNIKIACVDLSGSEIRNRTFEHLEFYKVHFGDKEFHQLIADRVEFSNSDLSVVNLVDSQIGELIVTSAKDFSLNIRSSKIRLAEISGFNHAIFEALESTVDSLNLSDGQSVSLALKSARNMSISLANTRVKELALMDSRLCHMRLSSLSIEKWVVDQVRTSEEEVIDCRSQLVTARVDVASAEIDSIHFEYAEFVDSNLSHADLGGFSITSCNAINTRFATGSMLPMIGQINGSVARRICLPVRWPQSSRQSSSTTTINSVWVNENEFCELPTEEYDSDGNPYIQCH